MLLMNILAELCDGFSQFKNFTVVNGGSLLLWAVILILGGV